MEAGGAIGRGDVGKAAGALGGALGSAGAGASAITGAAGNVVSPELRQGFQDASRAASAAGPIARGVGPIVEAGAELLEGLLGQRHPVHYELEIADEEVSFRVQNVQLHEALDELYEGRIDATFGLDHPLEERELLSKDVSLTIERGDERRHFRGIIRHARVRRAQEHHVLHLDVVPALWLASETLDSRIYQDLTVPELVEKVVQELFGSRQRKVKRELPEEYERHEYLVQHRESHFAFLSRLMREEGIFFYFDHDEDDSEHEVLVLADSNSNRPLVRPAHDGVVEYDEADSRR
ncbi:MAG TPA: contractile injection system protein, VgrG/Pvc8 family, partial [Sandaracinaceae bacterium]